MQCKHFLLNYVKRTIYCVVKRFNRDRGNSDYGRSNGASRHRDGGSGGNSRSGSSGGNAFRSNGRSTNDRGGSRPGIGGDRNLSSSNKQNPGENLRRVRWEEYSLTPFQKNFYKPCESASARTPQEIERFYHKNEITTKGRDIPAPLLDFYEGGFPDYAMREIHKCGFERPTAIQAQGWPIALSGRDLVGIAQTGYVSYHKKKKKFHAHFKEEKNRF